MKPIIKFIFIFLITSLHSYAIDYKKDFSHLFDVQQGVKIIVENGDGDVVIESWDQDQVKVDVVYHSVSSDKDNVEFDVEFNQKNNSVYIIGREYRGNFNFAFHYRNYKYKISAPSYASVDLKGSDGDIIIRGINGGVECRTDDGNIYLADIRNELTEVYTTDGDVTIKNLNGGLYVKSDDGDVTIEDVTGKQVQVKAADGDVNIFNSKSNFRINSDDGGVTLSKVEGKEIDVRTSDGDVDIFYIGTDEIDFYINTDDGRVDLKLDKMVSAAFVIETNDGNIRFNASQSHIITEKDHFIRGEFGSGKGKIHIQTSDGSVHLTNKF